MTRPPFIDLDFAPAAVAVEDLSGGGHVLRSPEPLGEYPPSLGAVLRARARDAADRVFLAERAAGGGWRELTYARVAAIVRRLGQAFLDRGLGPERPIMVLSENSVDHALVALGAMEVGVPVSPISPAYALLSQDHGKLKTIAELLRPGMIYVADGDRYAGALAALDVDGVDVVVSANPPPGIRAAMLDELSGTEPGAAVEQAFAGVGPDTVAKVLFTSGSTGVPKGVINTQRMLCSNQQAIAQLWRFLARRPPIIVDWLPWSHTFGGNHNFNMILYHGGALYIDGGKPAPGLIEQTIANLREISPTLYFNVPRGFDMLIPYLQQDAALRERFFCELDVIFYAGAALPQNLWERLEELSIAARGERVRMLSAWGSTETSPLATSVHFTIERAGVIGLPAPGTAIKMAPSGARLELRVKGPNVTPGYWRRDDLTAEAFDGDGFFRMGDAGRLADPDDPARGIVFDGRTAENFKLTSGTWVHVGELRLAVIAAAAPLIQDAVVTGHDRESVGLLIFPNQAAVRALVADLPGTVPLAEVLAREEVRHAFAARLAAYNQGSTGSSRRIDRVLIVDEPPSIDANEITDKGYINQRAVLDRRAELVERLYSDDPATIRVV